MKFRAIPNYVLAVPVDEESQTEGGIIKPAQSIARKPWATVISIHATDSDRTGIRVGDNVMFHAANGGACDAEYNGKTYVMLHVDNLVTVVEEDDPVLVRPGQSVQLQ